MRFYGSEDNYRWVDFDHRPDDIVISTRSKCGTTLAQMMCALLVFQDPDLPAPLSEISPWLDWSVEPAEVMKARLYAQQHRRIIKTHTPLDGLPLDPDVTYVVVGRHPLDVAVSLYHHAQNIDRDRHAELSGKPRSSSPARPLPDWLGSWMDPGISVEQQLDTLPGLVHHLADAWARRQHPNVLLLHYQDLIDSPRGQLQELAGALGIDVPDRLWPELADAASFDAMKRRAAWLAPDTLGVLKDPQAFFRTGQSGEGRSALDDAALDQYQQRIEDLASPELISWLHRE